MNRTKALSIRLLAVTPMLFAAALHAQTNVLVEPESLTATDTLINGAIELIDQRVAEGLARDGVGGVTVGIVIGDKLAWTKSYGLADEESSRPASRNTVYRIASITKSFTALMLAQLVERGVVNYSDSAAKYLPELHKISNPWSNGSPISLLQLANMTAGIQREPDNVHTHGYLRGPPSDWEKTTLRAMTETSVIHEPGTRYEYSNMGYSMLALALSRAANKAYIDYQFAEILKPLGMDETVFALNDELRSRMATGYIRAQDGEIDSERAQRERNDHGYTIPAGGLYTTVDDLAKFVMLHLGHGPEDILGRAALARTHTGFQANGDLSYAYGLGLTATRHGEAVLIGNVGGVYGYASAMYFHPKTQCGVIVLRNATGNVFGEDKLGFDALAAIVKKAEPAIDALIASAKTAIDNQQWKEAAAAYGELQQRSVMTGRMHFCHGHSLLVTRADIAARVAAYRASYEFGYEAPTSAYRVACASSVLGNTDDAIKWLYRARDLGVIDYDLIAREADLATVRDDPRFQSLLQQLKPNGS